MSRNKLTTWRNKCDKLMQEIGHKVYKKCLLCENKQTVLHHLVPKSVSSILRYDWNNLIPLCQGCHLRLHQSGDPTYEWEIIKRRGGDEWYERLRAKGRQIQKINISYYEKVYEELKKKNESSHS